MTEQQERANASIINWIDPRSKLMVLIIAVLVSLVYGNTVLNGYSVDDDLIVDGNAQAEQGFDGVKEIFATNYFSRGEKKGSYRPIPRASFAIEHEFFDGNPHISHALNIFLFFLTCWLVLALLILLFPNGNDFAIAFAVVVFLVHPIHTEVVASLKNRDELLQLFFNLLSCVLIVSYARKGNVLSLAGAMLFFMAALMSKESAIQFLAVFPLVFYYADGSNLKRAISAGVGQLATTLAFGSLMVFFLNPDALLWMDASLDEYLFIEHPLMHTADKSIVFGTGIYGLGYYLKLFVLPYPLGFYYGFDQIALVGLTDLRFIASLLVLAGLAVVAVRGLKDRSMLTLGIFIMLICLSIFSNLIVQVSGVIAERFAYSSSLGYCIIAGVTLQFLATRNAKLRAPILGLGLLIIGVMACATVDRNSHWKSYLSLAEHDASTFKSSAVTHLYLAVHIQNTVLDTAQINRDVWMDRLTKEYQEVVRIHPESKMACRYVVLERSQSNSFQTEVQAYELLFNAGLEDVEQSDHQTYAELLISVGDREAAATVLQSWINDQPKEELAYQKAAENLLVLNDRSELEILVLQMEAGIPDSDLPLIYRGNLALMDGDQNAALDWFEKALKANPTNNELISFLRSLYLELGMPDKINALNAESNGIIE